MQAGRLDRRASLQHVTRTRSLESGQMVDSYEEYASVWASKLDGIGREAVQGLQVTGQITTQFRIRHRTDVQMTDRIVCEGLTYNIHSIAEIGRREGLEILATAVRT